MEFLRGLEPGPMALFLAGAAVVAGAPIFGVGLRALRLRRLLFGLREAPLDELPDGFSHVRGKVGLESPLFAPISAQPCAGYRLEVIAAGMPLRRSIAVRRPFRISAGGVWGRVWPARGEWHMAATGDLVVRAADPMRAGLLQLVLDRAPEMIWWRQAGGTLRFVESALVAGGECHVVGMARSSRLAAQEIEWLGTGTGDRVAVAAARGASEPDVWLGPGDHLDFLWVSDQPPDPAAISIGRLSAAGLVVGPLLSLLGMLYLANAADRLRALGRF